MVSDKATAIICAVRAHGEHAAIVRCMTREFGLMAGFVQGARSRAMRPVLIPGNIIACEWRARIIGQLPSLTLEPLKSRGQLMTEPLAAAGIDWVSALTAKALPENHPYPNLFDALDGLMSAIELAPAARSWAKAMARFEELILAELGYGHQLANPAETTGALARNRERLVANLLGDQRQDIMAARERLVERLKSVVA